VLIRPAVRAEYPAALKVVGDAFGIALRYPSVHTLVADSPHGYLLVAERDGVIVGTGGSVGFGPTGWIGGIAVAAEARGQRLGHALTEAAIAALGPRATLLLLASAAGRPIYDRLGFVVEDRYRVFWPPAEVTPAPAELRPLTPADRDAVLALDRRVTGEDRSLAIDAALDGAVATPDLSAVALRPPWPALPILAREPDAGAALLAATISPNVRLAVPETNQAAVDAILGLGCTEGDGVVRMRRGAPVEWRPDELWGVFSLYFG
jgi:predicted N-acetyltransferase YhbS